jgi:hypothetical protein
MDLCQQEMDQIILVVAVVEILVVKIFHQQELVVMEVQAW